MVRLVRALPGAAEIDLKGKKSGRGAYLCLQRECWHKGLKKGGLERALRTQISSENKESLMTQYTEQLAAAGKEAT
ncbi:MAG: YlxR family protein [SAR202 cluster bacterium]|nr:YlxR family protein [SAR202 cluster bacterium]